MSDQTVTVPGAPTADSGSERFLIFGFSSVCVIAEIAWLTALAWDLISQILNEMSYFHRRTADHDPKSKVDLQPECHRRTLPYFANFLSIRRCGKIID
jgi:hypothetical protein